VLAEDAIRLTRHRQLLPLPAGLHGRVPAVRGADVAEDGRAAPTAFALTS